MPVSYQPRASNAPGALSDHGDPLLPNLHVAVFVADCDRPTTAAGGYKYVHTGQSLLSMLWHSIARLYPNAGFTILTSPETEFRKLPSGTNLMRRPLSNEPLLLNRMRHYIAFLEQANNDSSYLFLDSDMLMLKRLHLDIEEDWDVAIAYKQYGSWINGGMFLVRANRREQALALLRKAEKIYKENYLSVRKWGADQAALRDAIGMTALPSGIQLVGTGNSNVLLLPIEDFAPLAPWYARFYSPKTWLLHFMGERKEMMPDFYGLLIRNDSASTDQLHAMPMDNGRMPRRVDMILLQDMGRELRGFLKPMFKPWIGKLRRAGAGGWRFMTRL